MTGNEVDENGMQRRTLKKHIAVMSKKLLLNRVAYCREYLVMFPRDTEDSQVESTRDLLSRENLLTLSQGCPRKPASGKTTFCNHTIKNSRNSDN